MTRARGMVGRAGQFSRDLDSYIEYRKRCDGVTLSPETLDFEDFLAFLDVEFYLGLRGSDTWSDDGNETQVVVKTLIGQILSERTPAVIPDIYLRFAEKLRPDDIVLTFNYDTLLERAMEAAGKPFRLFPDRYLEVGKDSATVDTSRDEVIVLKLHGSIDWFDRRRYRQMEEQYKAHGIRTSPRSPIFGPERGLRLKHVLDGPRFSGDPLAEAFRVLDLKKAYENLPLFWETPTLLAPSPAKVLYSQKFRDFWWGLGELGTVNFRMAIIGFSLSSGDEYSRQVIYRLVTNYQTKNWKKDLLGVGKVKRPLVIADLRQGQRAREAFRRRYSFVNWSRTKVYFDGFNQEVLGVL